MPRAFLVRLVDAPPRPFSSSWPTLGMALLLMVRLCVSDAEGQVVKWTYEIRGADAIAAIESRADGPFDNAGGPEGGPADCVVSIDCNNNGIPDADELEGNDCNGDGVPDSCQVELPFMVRVSENADGEFAQVPGTSNPAVDAVASTDRRYVAFFGTATNLVPGDENLVNDVFVKDLTTGSVENAHVGANGAAANGHALASIDISADGRYVSFTSSATNLIPGTSGDQLFMFDRVAQSMELVSISTNGSGGNNNSFSPAISSDSRYVVFHSSSSNLVLGDTNGFYDVFRRDRQAGATIRVSAGMAGQQSNGHSGANFPSGGNIFVCSSQVAISSEGRFVAFASHASNLVANDTNNARDVFVRDIDLGITERVSVSTTGTQANQGSAGFSPFWSYGAALDISADGRFVVFESMASNLVPNDTNNRQDVFVHDRLTHETSRLTIGGTGGPGSLIASAGVSDDGCFVGFSTTIESLVPGQNPASLINTFRYDRMSNAIEQVNRNVEGLGANNAITTLGIFRMSPDGQWFVFHSPATNLTDEPTNGQSQIFLRWMAWREDCAGNGIPDECEPPGVDCNGNGMADACECGCAGDTNGDGQVDGRDLQTFVVCLTTGCSPTGCFCSDLSGDGATAEADIPLFVDVLLSAGGSNCP